MNYPYYIATPIGNIHFNYESINSTIKWNKPDDVYEGIMFENLSQFENFISTYDWNLVMIKDTDNGHFMRISLSYTGYGYPLFKIYSLQ